MEVPQDKQAFVARFGGVFEHSPWVAERIWHKAPFASAEALHREMMHAVRNARPAEILALVRAHPELAGRAAAAGRLTAHSSGEQARLGLQALSRAEFKRLAELNRRYRDRHGFPCIIALALHATRESVLAELESRIANDTPAEFARALEQIGQIARGRLEKLVRPVAEA